MWNCFLLGWVCIACAISPAYNAPLKRKSSAMSKAENIEKLMNFERRHQRAFSSNERVYQTWHKFIKDPTTECQCLLWKIFPKKDIAKATGEVEKISLKYKYINDEKNKPFPVMRITSLICRLPTHYMTGSKVILIRSPTPDCAFYMNRISKNTYYIAQEVCKSGVNPQFWHNMFLKQEVSCTLNEKNSGKVRRMCKTGQIIVDDHLIRKYENEHQQFYKECTKEGDHLEWPALDKKYLSIYCKKYLQQSTPKRKTDNVTGTVIRKTVHYEKENTSITSEVPIVECKIQASEPMSYYMTRAPEEHCVYGLRCRRCKAKYTYTIIHKHCDFKGKPFIPKKSLKQKRIELNAKVHRGTGQPIARDEYLLAYELEHQEFFKEKRKENRTIQWPHAMVHLNLDSYCHQYIRKCAPFRNSNGVMGMLTIVNLHYQKLNTNENLLMTAVQCCSQTGEKRCYYVTMAPETNCVYALLRQGCNENFPLVIIFKHCDFEVPTDLQTISQDHHDYPERNIIPKSEVKEEKSEALETLQLFPNN